MDLLIKQAIGNIQNTANRLFIQPIQQGIQNWGVQNPQQTSQILQAPRQIKNAATNAFVQNQKLSPWRQQIPFNLPKINLPNAQTGGWGTDLAINQFLKPMAESVINTPYNIIAGSNKINQGLDTRDIKKVGSGYGQSLEAGLNLVGFGAGTFAKQAGKTILKPTIKQALIQGGKVGSKYGAAYGLSTGLQKEYDLPDLLKEIGIGALGGAIVGGGVGSIGGIIGKLVNRPPKVEAQLRDLGGRWVAGNKPVKPSLMPKAQWDFQINFNRKYGRNPYTPVYTDDLNKALGYEVEKRGAGLSIRDVNKDKNPLGVKPDDAFAGLYDTGKLTNVKGSEAVNLDRIKAVWKKTASPELASQNWEAHGNSAWTKGEYINDGLFTSKRITPDAIYQYDDANGLRKIGGSKGWQGLIDTAKETVAGNDRTYMTKGQAESFLKLNGDIKPQSRVAQPTTQTAGLYDAGKPVTLYHGGTKTLTKDGLDYGTFLTANKQEALDYANMRAKGRGGKPIVSEITLNPNEYRLNSGTGEYQFIGKTKNLSGGKYPESIYKAINDVEGSNLTRKEVDAIPLEELRARASQGFAGGRDEFDKLVSRVAQPTIADAKPQLSSQALSEGRTTPVKGSDISVKPMAQIRAEVKGNLEPLPWETTKPKLQTEGTKSPLQKLQELTPKNTESPVGVSQAISPEGTAQQPKSLLDQSFGSIINRKDLSVKEKVGLLDYLRTPDRVLKKIGLGKQADEIRSAYGTYIKEMPQEIDKITQWSKQVPKESNQRIFQFLDGQPIKLNVQEAKVAKEVKSYLAKWADKLGLPKDQRITNYITHIFDRDLVKKEFDPEFASLMRDKVAGSVYDPFVQERLGKAGYVEDTWRALDAYVKRAVRKVNMDPVLERVSQASNSLEDSQFNYVKSYIDRVNMRPTQVDNLLDNSIKQIIGYKLGQRPTTVIARNIRQAIYRGTLGLNPASALKNISQGANTYAKLGEKYTVVGYTNFVKSLISGSKELEQSGVLKQDFIQDRTISATKQFTQAMDKGLFAFFEGAEKINRGAAYFGAKAKAIGEGKTEEQAIEFAKQVVRDTQFQFASIDTPPVLASDMGKVLLQFQSYNLKQAEFLGEMIKAKDLAGLTRYTVASLAFVLTIGKALGMKPEQIIPSLRIGGSPLFTLGQDVFNTVTNQKDQFGNQPTPGQRLKTLGKDLVPFVPAGVQIRKTVGGLIDTTRGYAENNSGNVKYPVNTDIINKVKGSILGPNNLPEAQQYRNADQNPLSPNQSTAFKSNPNPVDYFNSVMQNRADDKAIKDAKATGGGQVGEKLITTDGKTINLAPPTTGQGIDAYVNQNWNISKARDIWKNKDNIPANQVAQAFVKLGVSPDDVRYDYLAHHSNDIKTQYILSKNLDHKTLMERLVTGRVESVSGSQFATNGVISNLNEQGLISDAEAKYLKNLKLDKTGKSIGKLRVKKGKKLTGLKTKVARVAKYKSKASKLKKIKLIKPLKLAKVKKLKVKA